MNNLCFIGISVVRDQPFQSWVANKKTRLGRMYMFELVLKCHMLQTYCSWRDMKLNIDQMASSKV